MDRKGGGILERFIFSAILHDGFVIHKRLKSPSIPLFQRGRLLLPFVKGGGEGFKKAFFKAIWK